MRILAILLVSLATIVPAAAQTTAAPVAPSFASAADLAALVAKAKADYAGKMISQPIVSVPPYRMAMEYRRVSTPATLHEKDAELVYIVDGSGTLIIGGTLRDEKRSNEANLSGTGIDGGSRYPLTKGGFVFIPPNTAHFFTDLGPDGLTIGTLHITMSTK